MNLNTSDLDRLAVELAVVVPAAARARVRVAVQKASEDIKRYAPLLAPVDTGNLRSSIHRLTIDRAWAITGRVRADAEYGKHVEYGTSRMAPQPFMEPALDSSVGWQV
ncbi:HK97-gp10 family putative phage morphogenesis protein [Aeromicrobium sp. CnD17-E]|uniref:HK97-gp10 family putative phage morphogenesis protein n=1 Tax=Aeromicrobium sp. CnD17-E TaxID=2954487 RepID=UPI0020973E75|nr:HK97-gp10 family putative phage morphogenesis protein [Aeromicrobium sp. CnD17-E]MCO7238698.1 HK97 gp10 family phage protein [Aeromicrobium sp. CnD17-E]